MVVGLVSLKPFIPHYLQGNVLEAGVRVFGRIFVIFALIEGEQRMQEKPVIFYLFCIYAVSDLIRYPYYMFKTYDLGMLA